MTKILALVPARSGSKGIPGKNTRIFDGKPLISHAIGCARQISAIDSVLVSTDDKAIAEIAIQCGAEAPFIRPKELAEDTTPMLPVIQHAVRYLESMGKSFDLVVLLQPTSPFRLATDIQKAINLIVTDPQVESVVSVEEVPAHLSPYYVMKIEEGLLKPFMEGAEKITRRQDAPKAFTRNGQFYIFRVSTLLDKNSIYGKVTLPFVTTHAAVNLDTVDDWRNAELLIESVKADKV